MKRILEQIEAYKILTSGKQQEYYSDLLKAIKPVKVVSIHDVFTPDEILLIKSVIKPRRKHCYKNASLLTALFPYKVRYVEGKVIPDIEIVVDHALNKVGDVYVDITYELGLNMDVANATYSAYAEYNYTEIAEVGDNTGYYGDVYNYYWREKQKK